MTPRPRFAILGSGRGSNAVALMSAFRQDMLDAELAVVIGNVTQAPILARAVEYGYPSELLEHRGLTRKEHEQRLRQRLDRHRVDHLLLAGYQRLLSPEFVRDFSGVILNIHPSLLPDFPGRTAVADQWQAGVPIAGATVHVVDAKVDTGPILLCGSLLIRGDEGVEGLAERIRSEVEHVIYPRAVQLLLHRLRTGSPLHQEEARLRPPHCAHPTPAKS